MSNPVFDLPGSIFFSVHSVDKRERGVSHLPSVSPQGMPVKQASQRIDITAFAFIELEAEMGLVKTAPAKIATRRIVNQASLPVTQGPIGTVISAVPVSRISGIERLGSSGPDRLVGTDESDVLIGKLGDDRLIGNAGNDQITGGRGQDWLQGGTGFDRFFFNHVQEGVDYIDDFSVIFDWIVVSAKGFKGGLQPGLPIDRQQFHRGATAVDRSDRFIYHPSSGSLFFDPDGTGAEKPIEFAQLSRNLALTSANIHVIS